MISKTITPGPWRYFKQGDGTRFHITARPATKPGNAFEDFATVDIRHEADARLMAAAPQLLKVMEGLVEALRAGPPEVIGYDRNGEMQRAFNHGWNENANRLWQKSEEAREAIFAVVGVLE